LVVIQIIFLVKKISALLSNLLETKYKQFS
jgi:hypothetical protein